MYTFIIILILIFLIKYYLLPCNEFNISKKGNYYTSRNSNVAQVLDVLRDISYDLSNKIEDTYGKILKKSLEFTTFRELIYQKPTLLGWNYDKGREIGIKITKENGEPQSANNILYILFHELAHTINRNYGHGQNFNKIDDHLQGFKKNYVNILINNTFIKE